jgi:hypothetical protein
MPALVVRAVLVLAVLSACASAAPDYASLHAALQSMPQSLSNFSSMAAAANLTSLLHDPAVAVRSIQGHTAFPYCSFSIMQPCCSRCMSCGARQVTLFAPSDAAWAALTVAQPALAAELQANAGLTAALLMYHGRQLLRYTT